MCMLVLVVCVISYSYYFIAAITTNTTSTGIACMLFSVVLKEEFSPTEGEW